MCEQFGFFRKNFQSGFHQIGSRIQQEISLFSGIQREGEITGLIA
jgi:hypothetical protein